jgi:cytochrome c553
MKSTGLRLVLPALLLAAVFPVASHADSNSDKQTVEAKIRYCKDCHGQQGQGFTGAYPVPRLAGQTTAFLESRIDVITEHQRDNPTTETFMAPALGSVAPEIRKAVMAHFTQLNPPPAAPGPQEQAAAGRRIYEDGIASEDVPACTSCHGPDAKGLDKAPRLAGQIYPYVVKVLSHWSIINRERSREGGGAVKGGAHKLSQQQIEAVAAYVSNLN